MKLRKYQDCSESNVTDNTSASVSSVLSIRDKVVLTEICKYYLCVYRGEPKKEIAKLIRELDGYIYIHYRKQKIPIGSYVRYLPKDYTDTRVRVGGYVLRYDDFFVYLGRSSKKEEWKVDRRKNFVFYTTKKHLVPKRKKPKEKQFKIILRGFDSDTVTR